MECKSFGLFVYLLELELSVLDLWEDMKKNIKTLS